MALPTGLVLQPAGQVEEAGEDEDGGGGGRRFHRQQPDIVIGRRESGSPIKKTDFPLDGDTLALGRRIHATREDAADAAAAEQKMALGESETRNWRSGRLK